MFGPFSTIFGTTFLHYEIPSKNEKANPINQDIKNQFETEVGLSDALDREYTDEEIALQLHMEEEYIRRKEDNNTQRYRTVESRIHAREREPKPKKELKDTKKEETSSSSCAIM